MQKLGLDEWESLCRCCCCQVASVVSDSVQPHRRQPTRLRRPWDSPGKNTGVGCHFLLQCMKVKVKVKSLSRVQLLAIPWTAAYQAPPSVGFSRQEYWNGVPLPSPLLVLGLVLWIFCLQVFFFPIVLCLRWFSIVLNWEVFRTESDTTEAT